MAKPQKEQYPQKVMAPFLESVGVTYDQFLDMRTPFAGGKQPSTRLLAQFFPKDASGVSSIGRKTGIELGEWVMGKRLDRSPGVEPNTYSDTELLTQEEFDSFGEKLAEILVANGYGEKALEANRLLVWLGFRHRFTGSNELANDWFQRVQSGFMDFMEDEENAKTVLPRVLEDTAFDLKTRRGEVLADMGLRSAYLGVKEGEEDPDRLEKLDKAIGDLDREIARGGEWRAQDNNIYTGKGGKIEDSIFDYLPSEAYPHLPPDAGFEAYQYYVQKATDEDAYVLPSAVGQDYVQNQIATLGTGKEKPVLSLLTMLNKSYGKGIIAEPEAMAFVRKIDELITENIGVLDTPDDIKFFGDVKKKLAKHFPSLPTGMAEMEEAMLASMTPAVTVAQHHSIVDVPEAEDNTSHLLSPEDYRRYAEARYALAAEGLEDDPEGAVRAFVQAKEEDAPQALGTGGDAWERLNRLHHRAPHHWQTILMEEGAVTPQQLREARERAQDVSVPIDDEEEHLQEMGVSKEEIDHAKALEAKASHRSGSQRITTHAEKVYDKLVSDYMLRQTRRATGHPGHEKDPLEINRPLVAQIPDWYKQLRKNISVSDKLQSEWYVHAGIQQACELVEQREFFHDRVEEVSAPIPGASVIEERGKMRGKVYREQKPHTNLDVRFMQVLGAGRVIANAVNEKLEAQGLTIMQLFQRYRADMHKLKPWFTSLVEDLWHKKKIAPEESCPILDRWLDNNNVPLDLLHTLSLGVTTSSKTGRGSQRWARFRKVAMAEYSKGVLQGNAAKIYHDEDVLGREKDYNLKFGKLDKPTKFVGDKETGTVDRPEELWEFVVENSSSSPDSGHGHRSHSLDYMFRLGYQTPSTHRDDPNLAAPAARSDISAQLLLYAAQQGWSADLTREVWSILTGNVPDSNSPINKVQHHFTSGYIFDYQDRTWKIPSEAVPSLQIKDTGEWTRDNPGGRRTVDLWDKLQAPSSFGPGGAWWTEFIDIIRSADPAVTATGEANLQPDGTPVVPDTCEEQKDSLGITVTDSDGNPKWVLKDWILQADNAISGKSMGISPFRNPSPGTWSVEAMTTAWQYFAASEGLSSVTELMGGQLIRMLTSGADSEIVIQQAPGPPAPLGIGELEHAQVADQMFQAQRPEVPEGLQLLFEDVMHQAVLDTRSSHHGSSRVLFKNTTDIATWLFLGAPTIYIAEDLLDTDTDYIQIAREDAVKIEEMEYDDLFLYKRAHEGRSQVLSAEEWKDALRERSRAVRKPVSEDVVVPEDVKPRSTVLSVEEWKDALRERSRAVRGVSS